MRSENSGLIDLDALLKEASQPELPQSAEDSLEVTAPPVADDSLRAISARPKRPARERPTPIPWIVALAAGITVIALVVSVARSRDAAPPVSLGASLATVVVPSPAAAVAETTSVVTGTSLGDLPAATSASASAATPSNVPRPSAPSAPMAASARLVAITDAPPAGSGDLGGAMREAVGPRSSADVVVAAPSPGEGARQLRPSPGAVVGAINSVMPAARICLGDSEVVRNATIVFRSDGTVARVDIAGTPNVADECIRGALSKARTMPFLADTFAARATVRP